MSWIASVCRAKEEGKKNLRKEKKINCAIITAMN